MTTSKTASEQASASVGPVERRHPKLEALDAAAQDVFDNEGEIADRLIDQYSKAYNALADDLDAQARQIAALRGLLADTWCRGCNNRIGFTGDYSGEQRRYVDAYGNRLDWRTCHSCKAARVALEEPQGEAQ